MKSFHRHPAWCCLILAASLALTACGSRETRVEIGNREQILHLANGSEPQNLDPHTVTGVPEHNIIVALLEGLVSEDPTDLTPVPGVAERWDISEDETVYTFHFREDARWSNGDPVTALDFVNSFKRILTPTLAGEYAYMLFVMKNAEAYNKGEITDFSEVGATAVNDRTLQITLNNPAPYFLSLLNHSS
ncbi:MAG TPA: ABC transporter substrate-binding protein, partial [Methylomirabilota bacterium]|nr:ABC transporter substrate-binding protein [Methylomirabilota bacterium]